ncbi:ABC transporter permease [Streptosporangium canum]|uniref:Oligopeptide transport system permease protein OppC n=1 Tax=Streptosporangium canum TaxID=324952 RepID=A0A1I3TZ22_9ACTN|nr:ABC transporter permease [Streptosporangium canum]SFJ75940.1 peptide/nickel transport system permease protein [Streptosporangium canum]
MRSKVVLARLARNPQARYGLVALLLLLLLAYVGPFVGAHTWTDKDFLAFLEPPSAEHWWGTTQIGQDVYAVTLRGMQKSIVIGFLVALFSTGLAALVGAAAGYFGGWVDRALMWGADLLLVLPSFLIIAILSPNLKGGSWLWFVVLLAAFSWMITSRVVRSMTLSLREREYILAARYMGIPGWRIILRHVVPNLSSLLIIDATLNVSAAIIGEASLSFFGFGVQPPDVSLGTLIAAGSGQVTGYPWLFLFPAGLLVLLVLSVNLVGDGLRDALDPGSNQ